MDPAAANASPPYLARCLRKDCNGVGGWSSEACIAMSRVTPRVVGILPTSRGTGRAITLKAVRHIWFPRRNALDMAQVVPKGRPLHTALARSLTQVAVVRQTTVLGLVRSTWWPLKTDFGTGTWRWSTALRNTHCRRMIPPRGLPLPLSRRRGFTEVGVVDRRWLRNLKPSRRDEVGSLKATDVS